MMTSSIPRFWRGSLRGLALLLLLSLHIRADTQRDVLGTYRLSPTDATRFRTDTSCDEPLHQTHDSVRIVARGQKLVSINHSPVHRLGRSSISQHIPTAESAEARLDRIQREHDARDHIDITRSHHHKLERYPPQYDINQEWVVEEKVLDFDPKTAAVIIVDMWDQHWCSSSEVVVAELAPKVNRFANKARSLGMQIVHASSEVIGYYRHRDVYKEYFERLARVAETAPEVPRNFTHKRWHPESPMQGCASQHSAAYARENHRQDWKWKSKQHDDIDIKYPDIISEDGYQITRYLWAKGITQLIYVGVHLNECVSVSRNFSLYKMYLRGFKNSVIARDLTDVLNDPSSPPSLNHNEAMQFGLNWVERDVGALTFDSRCFVK
eukprot:TRINITY_DN2629_c0_g1_i1.p1 TRINITY_DN2629_c0_g1~~TRINITY_DN2629_c0_g1_i1.p1  ORF type:complete len:381 (-),score=44.84 TRINITY_DN2629_c0_g1_i1:22-1164(-)